MWLMRHIQNTNAHLLEFVNAVNIKSMLVRREIEVKEQTEQEKIQNDQLSTVETETKEEDRLLEENDSHQPVSYTHLDVYKRQASVDPT